MNGWGGRGGGGEGLLGVARNGRMRGKGDGKGRMGEKEGRRVDWAGEMERAGLRVKV